MTSGACFPMRLFERTGGGPPFSGISMPSAKVQSYPPEIRQTLDDPTNERSVLSLSLSLGPKVRRTSDSLNEFAHMSCPLAKGSLGTEMFPSMNCPEASRVLRIRPGTIRPFAKPERSSTKTRRDR